MAMTLVFLGRLQQAAGAAERKVEAAASLAELFATLDPALAEVLGGDRVKIAVNGQIVADRAACVLNDGDEIAFLPPVSGG
jgi:sulfur-carrier protein